MKHTLEERIVVPRSLQECFSYLADFSTIEQWDPGVSRAEKITPGPVAPGTTYRISLNLPLGQSTMIYRQKVISPHRRLQLEGSGKGIHALDTLDFQALGNNQTEIRYRAELTLSSLSGWSKPVMRPVLQRIGRKAAAGLTTALTPMAPPTKIRPGEHLKNRLVLCKMADFGKRGYQNMPQKSHSYRLDGKTAVVTGPTSGLGLSAACELARLGAHLILLGRDNQRLAAAAETISDTAGVPSSSVTIYCADLASLAETAAAAAAICKHTPQIDILINNAGALYDHRQESPDGNELSLAVNLLAPALLTEHLGPSLCPTSRIINVVSGGLYLQSLHLDDMQFQRTEFSGTKAYARAKRALLTLTQHAAPHADYLSFAMHPGWADTPGVAKSLPAFRQKLLSQLRDNRMGADTMVWLASDPGLSRQHCGLLWFDRRPQPAAIIPGSAPRSEEVRQLVSWVAERLAPFASMKVYHQLRSKAS